MIRKRGRMRRRLIMLGSAGGSIAHRVRGLWRSDSGKRWLVPLAVFLCLFGLVLILATTVEALVPFARVPLRLRRLVARLSGFRLIPSAPLLRDRKNEPARREAWLRDQYQHPEEHRHTLAEVQGWFDGNGVEYVRAYPSALIGEDPEDLFACACDNWRPEAWLAQLGWIRTLGQEGGLFITVGRRNHSEASGAIGALEIGRASC